MGLNGIEYDRSLYYQWKFEDPKMEVLYHIRPYFVGISWGISWGYPLVNIQKTMERSTMLLMGKSPLFQWPYFQ